MASSITMRVLAHCFLLLGLFSTITAALQVTPNSPCSSVCLDSSTGDASDPGASTTDGDDIVCSNREYASEKGRIFQGCMSCLQNSTYSQGSENDQSWFIYNIRYAFAHCVFGVNGTGIGSYPCVTSEACGPLKTTVSKNLVNNTGADAFAYCSYNGGSTFGDTFGKCLDCMSPDTEHGYVTNFFVALEAGCEQRPTAQGHIAVNGTLFSNTTIGIVNLNANANTNTGSKKKSGPSTTVIIVVTIISILVAALIAGCTVLQLRKRRNRKQRSALEDAAARLKRHGGGGSSMDFQCATHVNPFSPGFRNSNDGWDAASTTQQHEGMGVQMATAVVIRNSGDEKLHMVQYHPQQHQQHQQPIHMQAVQVQEYQQEEEDEQQQEPEPYADVVDALHSHPPTGPVRNFSRKDKLQQQQPAHITTVDITRPEPAAMTSPMPYSPDSYVTPSSTTSATPFLSGGGRSAFSPDSPSMTYSTRTSSPLVRQESWEETPRPQQGGLTRGGLLRSKVSKGDVSAPVATRQLQTSFPPPPKR